jgi:hypothetical protein
MGSIKPLKHGPQIGRAAGAAHRKDLGIGHGNRFGLGHDAHDQARPPPLCKRLDAPAADAILRRMGLSPEKYAQSAFN